MAEQDVLSLADRFYGAAMDEGAWGDALQDLAEAFGGRGANILDLCGTPPLLDVSPGLVEMVAAYQKGWWHLDPVYAAVGRLGLKPGVHLDTDFLSDAFRAGDPFFQEFLRPNGTNGMLCLMTAPFDGALLSISIQREIKAGPVEAAERCRFSQVARHLSRAAAIRLRLRTASALQAGLAGRLADFDCAVAAVDRSGRALLSNAAFDALGSEGLGIRGGRVVAAWPRMQGELDRLIGNALDPALRDKEPDTLAIGRTDSLLPLLVRAMPLKAETAERLLGAIPVHGVLLMVLNPSHPAYPDVTKALVALGLTPAQSRVAMLIAGGHSARSAAERLGITEETARTTVKHLYARLGIARQADLARLVAKAAPFGA